MQSPSFIGEYEKAMPDEMCDYLINMADQLISHNPSQFMTDDPQYGGKRKDFTLNVGSHNPEAAREINNVIQSCLEEYTREYIGINHSRRFMSWWQKLQVTPPMGGFHEWHNEHAHIETCDRVLTWMVYLNDLPEGEGETEFLHQCLRVRPKKGTALLWPAGWTHCHRGNPPHTTQKYVVTGWYNLVQDFK